MNLRIAAFVTASTLAHGAAVLWLNVNPTPLRLALGGEVQALRVTLLPVAQVTEVSALETQSAQAQPSTTNPAQVEAHLKQVTAPTRPATDPGRNRSTERHTLIAETNQNTAQETKTQPTTDNDPLPSGHNATARQHSPAENISEHISAALKNQLAQHFVYPWLARQRGWQGHVMLSLHIASNGALSHWKVVKTSGYRTLDQSALKAAKRIGRLPQAMRWLNGKSLEMRLPVQYKLLDS